MKDENWLIRFNAYENLGYTKEALEDEDCAIRLRAEMYFKTKGRFK